MKIEQANIAVIGATGAVGREVIAILESRDIHPKSIRFAASSNSAGEFVTFNNKLIRVEELTPVFFENVDVAICSAGSAVSEQFVNPAISKNTIVIDNCSYHRMDPKVPLVIPEVNGFELNTRPAKSIIANPNCTTIAMLVPLAAVHQHYPIQKIICSSYQSVSGAGQKGVEELGVQIQQVFQSQETESKVFPNRIAFNLIPNIGGFLDNRNTGEEQKMIDETRKILADDTIQVAATCVRVPTFIGHGLSVYVETADAVELAEVKDVLSKAPGITVLDDTTQNVYPVLTDCQGQDDVFVGRIRHGTTPNSFQCWIVSDNLRKGAALNAVQILEAVFTKDWL